jgi:hypothetical protein
MARDNTTSTDQFRTTHEPDHEGTSRTAARGGRRGDPLFKRFAVPREWRTKDNGVG